MDLRLILQFTLQVLKKSGLKLSGKGMKRRLEDKKGKVMRKERSLGKIWDGVGRGRTWLGGVARDGTPYPSQGLGRMGGRWKEDWIIIGRKWEDGSAWDGHGKEVVRG